MVFSKSALRSSLLLLGLINFVSSASIPRARPSRGFLARRDALPDGVPEDCTFLDTPNSEDDGCQTLADLWGISHEDFTAWNPSVGDDCSGIKVGESYCVERNWGVPIETSTTTETDPTPTKPSNGIETPSSVQPGIVSNCNKFYLVKKGDTCADIASKNSITKAEFAKWNPEVGTTCTGLWAEAYACVSIIGHEPTTTKPTSTKPTATNGIETPSPIQENMIKRCNKFHLVKSTTTCLSIESYYKVALATFYAWNPSVGKTCTALLVEYYVCVGVVGWEPPTKTTTTTTTTKAPSPTNGIATPSPIQKNIVENCNKFHLVKSTTTCLSIQSYYTVPLATFISWNPSVGTGCTSLLVDYYVCVSVVGWKPPATTTTTKVPTPTNGIATPTPIQAGMTKNCNKFHLVKSTTSCDSIQDYYKITMAQLASWNPAVGSKCTALWADTYVCVGVIGQTPTQPGNGIETPSPIQEGMTKSCKKFHLVKTTTTCASIQDYYKITIAQLAKWNTAIGSECTGLWAQYYVCVGI